MARPKKETESGELVKITIKADRKLIEDIDALAAQETKTRTDLLIDLMEAHRKRNTETLQDFYRNRKRIVKDILL